MRQYLIICLISFIYSLGIATGASADNISKTTIGLPDSYQMVAILCPHSQKHDNNSFLDNETISGDQQPLSISQDGNEYLVTFTLTNHSNVVLETYGSSGDTQMWLYDDSLNLIESNDDNGKNTFSMINCGYGTDGLPPGTYHVKVSEFVKEDNISGYEMKLTVKSICDR